MIYLYGLTITNGNKSKSRKFRVLKIPFKNNTELEKFRIKREYHHNPGLVRGEVPKTRVYALSTSSKRAEIFETIKDIK